MDGTLLAVTSYTPGVYIVDLKRDHKTVVRSSADPNSPVRRVACARHGPLRWACLTDDALYALRHSAPAVMQHSFVSPPSREELLDLVILHGSQTVICARPGRLYSFTVADSISITHEFDLCQVFRTF